MQWELYEITSLGSELMDGVQTEHLSIQMDFAKILDQMDKETREQISQSSALGGLGGAGALDQVDVTELEVWIDDAGYNRRTIMEMTLGADTAMVMDMRMFDFDETISIELPENVSEFSFPKWVRKGPIEGFDALHWAAPAMIELRQSRSEEQAI